MGKRLLELNGRIHRPFLKPAKILLIQPFQLLHNIHISVEIDKAVAGMIIALVETYKVLIGQVGNLCGISAGLKAVAGIREEFMRN